MEFPKSKPAQKVDAQPDQDPQVAEKPIRTNKQKDGKRRPPKEGQEGKEPRERKERPEGEEKPRAPREKSSRFQYPLNWKEEIDAATTLETKIPALPKKEELLQKPDFDQLRKVQTDCQNKIEKLFKTIDGLKADQKRAKEEAYAKNTSVFAELKDKKGARQQLSEALKANKDQKQKLLTELEAIDDKVLKLQKKAFGGKIMDKAEIDRLIKQKDDAYKNKQHTATEEKKHIDEMRELKVNLPLMAEHEALKKEREAVEQKLKVIKGESKGLFDKIQDLSGVINGIKAKLDAQEGAKKAEEPPASPEGKEKPKRELTAAEKEIREKIDKLYEEVSKLREKKKEASKKFDADMFEYEKQQFEVQKVNRMVKIQKRMKYERERKEREAEADKYRKEEEERAKELLQFKYRLEIESCENLVRILNEQRPENKAQQQLEATTPAEYKVDDKMLKEEGLKLIGRKKGDEEGVKPGQKKLNIKKKPSKAGEAKEEDRLFLDVTTLQAFTELKVMPPTAFSQIDAVIGQLNEKKAYFYRLREEEVEKAQATKEEETPKQESKEAGEAAEPREKKPRAEGKAENKKKIEMNDADFPSLS